MSNPTPRKYQFSVHAFDGGLNTKIADFHTPLNASPDLQNVSFDDYGAVQTTRGYQVHASLGSGPVDGLHAYVDTSNVRRLMAVCDGTVWAAVGSAGTFVEVSGATGIYSSGLDVKMFTNAGFEFLQNGNTRPYKYDGTYFTQAGPSAPVGVASAVSNDSGVLDGPYRWALSGINSANFETDYTIITPSAVTFSSGQAHITDIPVFPASAGITEKVLYRTTGLAGVDSQLFWRVTALSAGQTSVLDNNPDTFLDVEAPVDQGTMPACKFMTENKGYLFAAGDPENPTRLYYSEPGEPEKWPTANFIEIGKDDGYPITGLTTYGNSVVVHKHDGRNDGACWFVYMSDSLEVTGAGNWYVTKSNAYTSGQSDKAIVYYNTLMGFINRRGAYALLGEELALKPADSKLGQFAVDAQSHDIEPDIAQLNPVAMHKAAAINYRNRIWYAVPGEDSNHNNLIYIYDYSSLSNPERTHGAWSKIEAPYVNNFTAHDGDLYGGSSVDGEIYKLDLEDYYSFGATGEIDSYFWTAMVSGMPEHRDYDKVWRWLFVTVECTGDWLMDLTYRTDASSSGLTTQINLNPGGSDWGEMVYGVDEWGSGQARRRVRVPLRGMVSKYIQLRFRTKTPTHWWKVYEAEFFYTLRRDR